MPAGSRVPYFSVVLNTYNRASVVTQAVNSVLAQTLDDFELVVVDDGSKDDTSEVIARYDDPRVRYVFQENRGLAEARNTGIRESCGTFVAFLDDDDQALETWLESLSSRIRGEETGVVSCGAEIRSPNSPPLRRIPRRLGAAFEDQVGLFIPGTFCVRRDVLQAVGGFLEGLRCSEQTELSLRVLPFCVAHGLGVEWVEEPLIITNREAEERRPLRRADYLHDGALIVLEHHGERLRRSPDVYAHFKVIAAVQGARMGKYREARRLLLDAIRAKPSVAKHWLRLAAASFPPLGRRIWGTWEPPRPSPVQRATAPRVASDSRIRAVVRLVPGARALKRRLVRPTWPIRRLPVGPPVSESDWVTGPPAFVGIGAQRCGTSWWTALITEHPDVHVNPSIPKEIHFFDRFHGEPWQPRHRSAYHALFPRPTGKITGEWTPEYMLWPWCAPLIAECGVERLLVCLRDPVERYLSGWSFAVRRGAPAVPTIAGDAFHRGLYHRQLCWVLEHFERSQMLVLQYEACLSDPAEQIRRTYEFLGLDAAFVPGGLRRRVREAHAKPELDPRLRAVLSEAYRPDVAALWEAFPELDPGLWRNFGGGAS